MIYFFSLSPAGTCIPPCVRSLSLTLFLQHVHQTPRKILMQRLFLYHFGVAIRNEQCVFFHSFYGSVSKRVCVCVKPATYCTVYVLYQSSLSDTYPQTSDTAVCYHTTVPVSYNYVTYKIGNSYCHAVQVEP